MAELGASWPVPSRGGTSGKKKHPPGSHEGASGTPIAAVTVAVASDLLEESASGGDPVPISAAAIFAPVDPPQKQQKETATAARAELLPSKANINPRSPRPPLRPGARPQHTRPPVQNGHRGRNQQQFLGNGGGHHQQRPRHQRNAAGFFPHQQPAQVINEYGYQSAMMGHANPTPEWGFNPGSNLQWGPGPQMSPPRMNTVAPPENVFLRGHFPRPYFDGFSYYAPPFPTVLRPTQGQNPPWFLAPLPSVAETTLQSIPAKPPLPPDGHQLPAEITQEAEDVGMRLRKQIEYYFSDQNLVRDIFLRTCMDNEGWISVHTIANFPRVQSLTRDVGLILAALQTSPTVEVSVDKVRRKGEWSRWIIQRKPLSDASRGRRDD